MNLQQSQVQAFGSLTFQYLRPLLNTLGDDPNLIAIGAVCLDMPIGLIVARCYPENKIADIQSIFVKSDYRRIGVGTALLEELEKQLAHRKCEKMKLKYTSGKAITPVFQHFLDQSGWSTSVVNTLIYTTDYERMAKVPWLHSYSFPRNMQASLWSACTEAEREHISHIDELGYPAYLSPFRNEHQIEMSNSLVLRVENQIVGWSIVHRVSTDTLLYNSLFVHSQYQRMGSAMMLLAASINRQLEQSGQFPKAMFAVNLSNPVMKKMIDRWLKPYTSKESEMAVTYKSISQAGCKDAKNE